MLHPEHVNRTTQVDKREHLAYGGGTFLGCSSPVVARTPPQTRKGRCPVVQQSFDMYDIRIHRIVFEVHVCVLEKKEEEEEEEKKKEDEQIVFFTFGFLDLVKG